MQYVVKARYARQVGEGVRVAVELAPVIEGEPSPHYDVSAQMVRLGWMTEAEAAGLVPDAIVTISASVAP